MKDEKTTSLKVPYHKILSTYLANIMALEYNAWLGMTFKEAGLNYLSNKLEQASKAEETVIKQLKVVDKEIRKRLEEDKDFYSDFIYDLFRLEVVNQKRIRSLLDKIMREEAQKSA